MYSLYQGKHDTTLIRVLEKIMKEPLSTQQRPLALSPDVMKGQRLIAFLTCFIVYSKYYASGTGLEGSGI